MNQTSPVPERSPAVICAVDLSPNSQQLTDFAAELAEQLGAPLAIVAVTEFPGVPAESQFAHVLANQDQLAKDKAALSALTPRRGTKQYTHHHLVGTPARELIEFGRVSNAALIVVGTHGRSGINRLLMGSVAEAVLRKSTIPVLIFKSPQNASPSEEA